MIKTQNNKSTFNFKLREAKIPAVIFSNLSYQQYSTHVIISCELDPITPTLNIQLGYEANLVLLLRPSKKMWYFIDLMDKTYFPWLENCADWAVEHWFFSDSKSIRPRGLINVSQNINEDIFRSVGTLRSNRDADRCITDSGLVVIRVHILGYNTLKSAVTQS